MKRRLSHRTILAVSLAALWPVTPALAVAGLQHAALADDSQDDPPLRLAMSYSLAAPPRAPSPDVPQVPVVHAAHPLLDPRDAMARRLRLDVALHADPDPKRAPESAVVADSGDDADVPRAGPPDIVVGMPPPLFLWPARFQTVADRPEPIYLPTAPRPSEEPAPPQLLRFPERMERAAAAGHAEPPAAQRPKPARKAQAKKARRAQGARGPVLRGRAWRLANDAYRAYGRGRYAIALQRAEAALKLRPDVARLQLLRVYALQKLQRNDDALRAAEQAVAVGASSPELQAAIVNLRPAPAGSEATTTEAYRRGFPIATQAYTQYNAAAYEQAAGLAEEAVRADPSQGPWVLLWLDALTDAKRYEEAVRAGAEAQALGAPNRADIQARVRLAQQAIANQYAQTAYEAIARNRPQDGVASAREAARLAPDVPSHQMLLIGILQSTQDLAGAEQAATAALQVDEENTAVQLLRAYLRQQLGRSDAAQEDIQAVLGHDWIDAAQRRDTRLIGADLALAANRPQQALALLEPLPSDDAQADARRARARKEQGWGAAAPLDVAAYAPLQICRDTPYGTSCELYPWDAPGTDNPAARAYAAYGQKRYADAIALARRAVAEQPADGAARNLLTIALAAGGPAERREALQRLDTALQATPDDAALLRQRAYLYLAEDRPQLALQDFVAARSTGQAPATNILDEAYATAATGNRPAAAAMLRQAIDEADAGRLPLDRQQRFDTRSAVANFSREWGATVSVGYRGARSASNGLVGQPVSVPGNSVFSTAEAYWRPPQFLNSSTTTFDVYGRVSSTLRSGTDVTDAQVVRNPCGGTIDVAETRTRGAAGLPSTTAAIGARLTPQAERNLTFGIERQFLLGRAARSGALNPAADDLRCQLNNQASAVNYDASRGTGGWQAYMLYGFYDGTALRLDASDWFTMEGYLQAGYTLLDTSARYAVRTTTGEVLATGEGRLRRGQGFAAGEVRVGRSFLTPYSDRVVVFPHLTLAADAYTNRNRASGVPVDGFGSFDLAGNGRSWSVGAGPGVNLRYWLEGDRYTAQRAHVDWSLQYRANLGGGDASRSRGVFMNLSYSY